MAKDVQTANNGSGELRPVERFKDSLMRRVEDDKAKAKERTRELSESQIDAILSAPDLESMFNADEMVSLAGQNLVGVEQRLMDVTFASSDRFSDGGLILPNGETAFILVRSMRLSDGEILLWNNGSPLIIAKVARIEAEGAMNSEDADVVITATETSAGFKVLKLAAIPKRKEQAKAEVL